MKATSIIDFKDKEIKDKGKLVGGTGGGDIIIDKDKIKPPAHGND